MRMWLGFAFRVHDNNSGIIPIVFGFDDWILGNPVVSLR